MDLLLSHGKLVDLLLLTLFNTLAVLLNSEETGKTLLETTVKPLVRPSPLVNFRDAQPLLALPHTASE